MNALVGQTVVISGSSGIGLTARRARREGASIVLVARDAGRLKPAGLELGARTAAFDATAFALQPPSGHGFRMLGRVAGARLLRGCQAGEHMPHKGRS